MPDFIGDIEVPEITPSGTFPFISDYPVTTRRDYTIQIHPIANTSANLKIEQRYLIGTGARVFTFQRSGLSISERDTLVAFWEARKGSYQPFTYNSPSNDGASTVAVTVRFAGPLTVDVQAAGRYAVQVELLETPTTGPTYTLNSTETRFPGATLEAELLDQDQEIVPLVHIKVREAGYADNIYVSDRRCTVGAQLYQARMLQWGPIEQAIGAQSDHAEFVFGNADRVMSLLAADTNLHKATVEFALFHVGLGIKLNVWKGYVTGFAGEASNNFNITANEGIDLTMLYPPRLCGRSCWKPYDDGLNCSPPGTLDPSFPDADLLSCDHTYDGPNGCKAHDNERQFGGHMITPQGVRIKDNSTGTWGYGRALVNATSRVSDSIEGIPLAEVWTAKAIPVSALIAASRDESDFLDCLGIVGAGPLILSTNVLQHNLNGSPPHQVIRGSLRAYGIRLSSGPEPEAQQSSGIYPADSDHWFQLTETSGPPASPVFAAGTAFAEVRISDEPGIQLKKTIEDQMFIVADGGLPGYQWTDATTRIYSHPLNVPSWIVANMLFRAHNLQLSDATTQAALINVETFMPAGAVCQTTVDKLVGSGTEIQFEYCGVMRDQKPLRDWLTDVSQTCLGYYYFEFGKLAFGQRINSSVEEAFTAGNIIDGSLSLQEKVPQYNALTVEFDEANPDSAADRSQAFVRRTIEVADYDHIDTYGKKAGFLTLNGVSGRSHALRIGAISLREELGGINESEWRKARRVSFQTTILAMKTRIGKVCSLTHPDMPSGSGEFRISSWRLNPDYSVEIEGDTTTDSMYDLTVGPKPADVLPDPLPLERIELAIPLQPWFPDSEAPNASDPLWDETDKTFHVEQFYESQADGSSGAAVRIIGDHPTTSVIANVDPPRVGVLSTATSGGSLPAGAYVIVCISAIDGSGNETRVSKPMGVQCGASGGTHKITLGSITWPAGTTGYRVYAALDSHMLCRQLENGGSQPSSIDVTSVATVRTQGIPQENLHGLRARARRCYHPGAAQLTVTAVGAGTLTGDVTGWTPDEWIGRNILVLGDQSDGSAPPLTFAITDNDGNVFTCSPDPQAAGVEVNDRFAILLKATSFSATTIGDAKFENAYDLTGLDVDGEAGRIVRIVRGTGEGQERIIVSNTTTILTVSTPWETTPDTSSHFIIVEATAPYESSVQRLTSDGETVELRISVPNHEGEVLFVDVATLDSLGREPAARYNPWRLIYLFGDVGTGSAVAPGDVTLGEVKGPFYRPPDAAGIIRITYTVAYEPPSPLGTFDRTRLFLQAPDDAAKKATFDDSDGFIIPDSIAYTVDVGSNVFTSAGHPLIDGIAVRLSTTGAVPGGLDIDGTYYVRDATTNTFKLALTPAGAAIDITSSGTGTNKVIWEETSLILPTVQPIDKGLVPYDPEEKIFTITHEAPAAREYWRLYAVSASPQVENLLVKADQETPTPNVVLTVDPPPADVSGVEYVPLAIDFSQVGSTIYYQGDGGRWLWYFVSTWTNPSVLIDPRSASLGGYDMVITFDDGSSETEEGISPNTAPHTSTDRAVYFLPELVTVWLVSFDKNGNRNSITSATPHFQIVVQRTLGSAGEENAPAITGMTAESAYIIDGTGQLALAIRTTYTVPHDSRFGGVIAWAKSPELTAPGNQLTGIEPPTGSTYSELKDFPPEAEDWVIALISVDTANRRNSYEAGVTPTVTITVQPPHVGARLANVSAFSVTSDYDDADYAGQRRLVLTPAFTPPAGPQFSYIEFWAKREDGIWYHLGNPGDGGVAGRAVVTELPIIGFDWEFLAIANDVNGKDRDGNVQSNPVTPPSGTPSYTLHIDPPSVADPLPHVTAFSVSGAYDSGDYYGRKVLILTPSFTVPASRAFSYVEFWAKREDGIWYHLGNPAEGGVNGQAIVNELPEVTFTWTFAAISNDVNGKDRAGNSDSDPATPPSGTPTTTLEIPPPTGGLDGEKIVNIPAASFAAGIKPVELVSSLPALPDSAYPVGTLVVLTSVTPPKLYRVNNAGTGWTAAVDGLDLIADTVTAAAIIAGAVSTSELFAGEILVGQGGGKPTRFKVVDSGGATIGFWGDDSTLPFLGLYTKRLRIANTFATTNPRIEADGTSIVIDGASLALALNGIVAEIKNSSVQGNFAGLVVKESDDTDVTVIGAGSIKIHSSVSSGTRFALIGNPAVMTLYDGSSNERFRLNPASAGGVMWLRDGSGNIAVEIAGSSSPEIVLKASSVTRATLGSSAQLDLYDSGGTLEARLSAASGFGELALTTGGSERVFLDANAPAIRLSGSQVISTRKTGWSIATGTADRNTFDTATVSLEELAQRLKALIDDLHSSAGHGLIG